MFDRNHDPCAHETLALLRFGALEGRVLRALWEYKEITLADLHNVLDEPGRSVASLRAVLDRMRLKRLVHLRKVHRTHFYRAARTAPDFIRILRGQLLEFLGADGMACLLHAHEPEYDRDDGVS